MRKNQFEIMCPVSRERMAHKKVRMGSKEKETKFVILKPGEEKEIFALVEERCRDWRWSSSIDRQIIHDTYYDTPSHELKTKRFGLRIRNLISGTLLTLKGPATTSPSGGLERDEFESVPDEEFLTFLAKKIISLGVNLSENQKLCADPHDFLTSLGLFPIQKRRTARLTRRLYSQSSLNSSVELALDTVYYEIGSSKVIHSEIEVELMKDCSTQDYERLILHLKEAFLPLARVWGIDKLALGFWLRECHERGLLPRFVNEHGILDGKAYEAIEEDMSGVNGKKI